LAEVLRKRTICRPKSALFGANIWHYLKYMSSYSIFCVYITKFSLLWQQRLIWVIFVCTVKSTNSENTPQRSLT